VNEAGNPMNGVQVTFGFSLSQGTSNSLESKKITAITDNNGTVSSRGVGDTFGYEINLPGYYISSGARSLSDQGTTTVTVMLKKIDSPKPMYAKKVRATLPSDGKAYSYDLMMGDWLPPLGQGVTPDLIFVAKAYWKSVNDYDQELKLSFSNLDDGIQPIQVQETGSILRLPKIAPTSGYQSTWQWKHADSSKQEMNDEYKTQSDRAFFFRVRTTRDQNGLIKGMYGKISHDIDFGIGSDRKSIMIDIYSCYLNPDGTPTMEFDVFQNLFTLSRMEAVREP
jgi:hypothetical protein